MFTVLALIGIGLAGAIMIDVTGNEDDDLSRIDTDENEDSNFEPSEEIDKSSSVLETIIIDGIEFSGDFLETSNLVVGSDEDDRLDGQDGEGLNTKDHLFGGNGADHLIGGHGDVLVGGAGLDFFEVGNGGEVHLLDFQDDELIVIQYIGQPPTITGEASDDGTTILANGYPVVHIYDAYDVNFDQISLMKVG